MKIKSVLTALFCILFAYISCNTPKQQPDPLQVLSDKYKNRSPKTVKLTAPGKITLSDTIQIAKAIELYKIYVKDSIYYQIQSKISLTADIKDSMNNVENFGIRIIKGLDNSGKRWQNQILKYIDNQGHSRITDSHFLQFDFESVCPFMCDKYFLQADTPVTYTSSLETKFECDIDQIRYDAVSKRDTMTAMMIPKEILKNLIDSGATFFNLYNGIDPKNKRIMYLLSYNAEGKLLTNVSYSFDDTYMCPNYCDKVKYFN